MGPWRVFEPFACREEQVVISAETVRNYALVEWAARFKLGTAGYRDLLNPHDLFDLAVPFNPLTMAIITEAASALYQPGDTLHLAGEVRPWTAEFLDLAARIYAAHGFLCRLRGETDADGPITTTPIWMSSFGVFFEEMAGGENFTASHSQSFKGGRKPMDGHGMQLLDQAAIIEAGVRLLVDEALNGRPVVIRLASADSPLIQRDFNVTDAYVHYLQSIVPEPLLQEIRAAWRQGFAVSVSTEGGSMGRTSRVLFERLGIPTGDGGVVRYLHFREDSNYHGLGVVNGENHGVDPGKWQVYKNIGAQDVLRSGGAAAVFLWDPDGDRFNMVTSAPAAMEGRAVKNGLEVESLDDRRILVYFKPNQIYFLLLAFRLEQAQQSGQLPTRSWLLLETYPTSRSLAELAERFGVPAFFTPVGFKYFGEACRRLEAQIDARAPVLELTDERGLIHRFPADTRLLLMAEESGGAVLAGGEPLRSRRGKRWMLALKEKDAFQIGVTALALAARLFNEKTSMAEYYVTLIDRYQIKNRFYERRDVTLFDEALAGDERRRAQDEGLRRRDQVVAFFRGLAESFSRGECNAGQVTRVLQERCTTGFVFPPVSDIFWAGDGTLVEFAGLWWQLRASGTDAVLRYYTEGEHRAEVRAANDSLVGLRLDAL